MCDLICPLCNEVIKAEQTRKDWRMSDIDRMVAHACCITAYEKGLVKGRSSVNDNSPMEKQSKLRDQFAMAALTGYMTISDNRTYEADRDDCKGLSLEEWWEKNYLADAKHIYRMADAMLKARED